MVRSMMLCPNVVSSKTWAINVSNRCSRTCVSVVVTMSRCSTRSVALTPVDDASSMRSVVRTIWVAVCSTRAVENVWARAFSDRETDQGQ